MNSIGYGTTMVCKKCGKAIEATLISIRCGANPGRDYRYKHVEPPALPHIIEPTHSRIP